MTAAVWENRIVGSGEEAVSTLVANPRNWRKHPPHQREALRGVLRDVGLVQQVMVNRRTGLLVDGHLRLDLAVEDNQVALPVVYVDLAPDEEAEVLATLDPIAAFATADRSRLAELLGGIESENVSVNELLARIAKANDIDFAALGGPQTDPEPKLDHADELRATWGTELGQLWEIPSRTVRGKSHRVLCGDSTSVADVTRLMDGERATLFATDPPYLVDYDGTNHPHKWGARDANKDWSDSYHDWDKASEGDGLYDGFVSVAKEVAITDEAAWYCWHASRRQAMVEEIWEKHGAFVHQQIIWVKDRPILTRSWYMWQHEPCFFGWVRGQKPRLLSDDHPASVWVLPTITPGTQTDHPTSKPTEVFAIPMRQHTAPGEICYEPFSGSGSQQVAGEQLGRLVYGLELEPRYVAVILQRLTEMGKPRQVEAA